MLRSIIDSPEAKLAFMNLVICVLLAIAVWLSYSQAGKHGSRLSRWENYFGTICVSFGVFTLAYLLRTFKYVDPSFSLIVYFFSTLAFAFFVVATFQMCRCVEGLWPWLTRRRSYFAWMAGLVFFLLKFIVQMLPWPWVVALTVSALSAVALVALAFAFRYRGRTSLSRAGVFWGVLGYAVVQFFAFPETLKEQMGEDAPRWISDFHRQFAFVGMMLAAIGKCVIALGLLILAFESIAERNQVLRENYRDILVISGKADQLLNEIIQQAVEFTGADFGEVRLLDPGTDLWELKLQVPESTPAREQHAGRLTVAQWVRENRKAVLLHDFRTDNRGTPDSPVGSEYCLPLKNLGGGRFGLLSMCAAEPNQFRADQQPLLEEFAFLCCIAILRDDHTEPPPPPPGTEFIFMPTGNENEYDVTAYGQSCRVRGIGFRHIFLILQAGDERVTMAELDRGFRDKWLAGLAIAERYLPTNLSATDLEHYRWGFRELQEEIKNASEERDDKKRVELEDQLEKIMRELTGQFLPPKEVENLESKIRNAVIRAIKTLKNTMPDLGLHFGNAIHSRAPFYEYTPSQRPPWKFTK